MTSTETQAAIRAAAEALYPVLVEHSVNGAGCPCRACRWWLDLVSDEPDFAHGVARAYHLTNLKPVTP